MVSGFFSFAFSILLRSRDFSGFLVFFDHLFPANLIKLFRRQEIWIHVRSPTPHVAIHANRFRFKLLLTSAPRLREVVFFRVRASASEAIRKPVVLFPSRRPLRDGHDFHPRT